MADVQISRAVGLRFRKQNVDNRDQDQQKIITLLAKISDDDGGKERDWRVLPPSGGDGHCPDDLVDAIFKFQKHWHEKGRLFVVDGVVDPDKNSIKLMNQLASKTPPPNPTRKKEVDFIIRFRGGIPLDATQNLNFPLFELYKKKPNRRHVAITKSSSRSNDASLVNEVLTEIDRELTKDPAGEELGAIFINGNSIGGRNAVELAVELTRRRKRIKFVGIADAALFNDGIRLNQPLPSSTPSVASNKPKWFPPPIAANVKHNHFQNAENRWKESFHGKLWTGHIPFVRNEFHGEIDGFSNEEIHVPFQGNAHKFAGDLGDQKNGFVISTLLASL